ncbi:DNA polymerase III subunit delta' [Levilactobacillus bambusae]|uniref:DNA polymerase III subunit delta n=1 Tax=Levilactobacillus bambusae TaxID=2024736 RepID=A0A2V1MZ00_9LACO|nr:DNA polymerase III subunit delta' [Levilactobacillus bambusae]PWF99394.1 DNA polymerase III subunit delta' [Levilactobacillus bambusae]
MEQSPIQIAQALQPTLTTHFMQLVTQKDLAHAYLFSGQTGTGRDEVAVTIAMRLFCENVQPDELPCGRCPECQRILSGSHPDVVHIAPDGNSIKVDQVRYLKAEFSKSAVEGDQKVFIIDDAEKMTVSAANTLLKFIEEPVGNSVALLLTTNRDLILPTIQSRTQIVEFTAKSLQLVLDRLGQAGVPQSQQRLAATLTTSPDVAQTLLVDDWLGQAQHQIQKWYSALVNRDPRAFPQVQMDILPLAGNKLQQQWLLQIAVQIWHDTLRSQELQLAPEELSFPELGSAIQSAAEKLSTNELIKATELTLQTRHQLRMNLNFQNVFEALTLNILRTFS